MNNGFKLIVISAEKEISGEASIINNLFAAGLQLLHWRKPGAEPALTQQFLQQLNPAYHNRVVLHQHFELSTRFKVKGIHLNEINRGQIKAMQGYKIISTSFHTWGELVGDGNIYEYVFLSPVFNSLSKPGYLAALNLIELAARLPLYNKLPVIALGGITAENIMRIKETGFKGAAVLGSIWQANNPVTAFKELQIAITNKR